MKKREDDSSGASPFRIALSVALTSMAAILLASSFRAAPAADDNMPGVFLANSNAIATTTASGARIYVTTKEQKIGGIGTGGCSLQEAIYSSVLHSSFFSNYFGGHGIAIDSTDPDHFIATDCVAGTGNGDTIVLPSGGGVFPFNSTTHPPGYLDGDAHNPYGPTATPIIFSTMTIEGSGATLQWTGGSANVRLLAVGPASVTVRDTNGNPLAIISGTGAMTLRDVYIKGFHVKGGDGASGGGGGMGAGGAIYLQNGTLIVENSTFDNNRAVGGHGSFGLEGGGGGIGGNGGAAYFCNGCGTNPSTEGGGGGGSKGTGGNPGGGGGTVFSGNRTSGGYLWGGTPGNNGQDGQGPGGGGGAGKEYLCNGGLQTCRGNGGNGAYGGGGGGGRIDGGSGGFGGGGGAGDGGGSGGSSRFGGGGGAVGNNNGGLFGGHSDDEDGGGGAGLGGAIFNDSGTVTIHNSTFYNNSATQGLAGAGVCTDCGTPASNGDGAGGAIFSRNGSLKLVDVTISGNHSSTSGAGLEVFGDSTASFVIQNTIVANNTITANNGATAECVLAGSTVNRSGVGNLIINNGSGSFGACPGVVTTTDPQLDPNGLQDNGGPTPTLAIPLFSSAMGMADPGTSLPYDQRYADRPQSDSSPRNGYDIGAYTVCRRFFGGRLQSWLCSETNAPPPPPTTTLTMQASPSYEGTTDPAPGSHTVDLNSIVSVQGTPNSSYHFTNWTGNVAQSSNPSTTITMSQAQTVTANFANGSPSADLHVTVSDGKTAAVAGAKNTYTIVVSNAGPSYVTGAVVKDTFPSTFTGVTFSATQIGGAYGFTVTGSGNINNTVTMPPGSSITYNATGKLSAAATGTVSDTASVTAPSGITDPNLGNNSATDTDNITFKADLKVTVSDGKTAATAGAKNTYTIVVTNAGPSKVIGAAIHDSFPSTFTSVTYNATQSGGASGFSASGSGNINNTVTMPPASKITYKATGTISASATGSISDTATVTAPSGVTDPNTANNRASDTDTL